ncbi:hypothetical protein ACG873_21780 [Mesorhizobium sp. AaZ16]|uniref:hypothetical protein n=1 Tax=Mesorhizobium sp. AaZ16 TaxID=3402289 RepID=UPI00374F8B3D
MIGTKTLILNALALLSCPKGKGQGQMPQFETKLGVWEPDELKVLEAVFEEACGLLQIDRHSPDAENIALKIMLMFQSGVDDRRQLLEAAITLPYADATQVDLRCN